MKPLRGNRFPCLRCGRALLRVPGRSGEARRIRCRRCRYLIFDYPRPCSGMVVLKGDRVLMLRRGRAPRKGCLDIPGGFLEAGEGIEEAARRELREETGLTVGRVRPLGFYWDRYFLKGFGYFPTMNFYFLARWRSGEPRAADDAAAAEWVPLSKLGSLGARRAWRHMPQLFRDVVAGASRPPWQLRRAAGSDASRGSAPSGRGRRGAGTRRSRDRRPRPRRRTG